MTGAALPFEVPTAHPDDDDDVAWALQTAQVQWGRGAYADAVVWLQRAGASAKDIGAAERAAQIDEAVQQISARLAEEANRDSDPDVVTSAPRWSVLDKSETDDIEVVVEEPIVLPRRPPAELARTLESRVDPSVGPLPAAVPPAAAAPPARPKAPPPPPRRAAPSQSELAPESVAPESLEPLSLAAESVAPESLEAESLAAESVAPESLEPLSLAPESSAAPLPDPDPESLEAESVLESAFSAQEPDTDQLGSPPLGLAAESELRLLEADEPVEFEEELAPLSDVTASEPQVAPPAEGEEEEAPISDSVPAVLLMTPVPTVSPPDEPLSGALSGDEAPVSASPEPAGALSGDEAPVSASPEPAGALSGDAAPVSAPPEPAGALSGDAAGTLSEPIVGGIHLGEVRGLEDLPEDAQVALAGQASLVELEAEEEVGQFEVALVLAGVVHVMPAVDDLVAASASAGEVVFTGGSLPEGVELRVVAGDPGAKVAVWRRGALARATENCPWVADELKQVADRLQALAGVAMGLLGERLDPALRQQVTERMQVRLLLADEELVAAGVTVPGLMIVGAGRLRVEGGEELLPGEFVLPAQVISRGVAPSAVRAGPGGALVLFGEPHLAQELLVSVPPLLELLVS